MTEKIETQKSMDDIVLSTKRVTEDYNTLSELYWELHRKYLTKVIDDSLLVNARIKLSCLGICVKEMNDYGMPSFNPFEYIDEMIDDLVKAEEYLSDKKE